MTSIDEVIARYTVADPEGLKGALLNREDGMKDVLNLAGAQFGLYPFIVAEVLAQVGLGTPLSEEERTYIRQEFVAGMENLRAAIENGEQPPEQPPPPDDPAGV